MMLPNRICLLVLVIVLTLCAAHVQAVEFSLEKTEEGMTVNIDGELFTKYVKKSGPKPILYPIIGPTGDPMTRNYPMKQEKLPHERQDHPHHRSFWFTHGKVGGVDFWSENKGHGTIVHRKFAKAEAGAGSALLVTHNDWMSPDGKKVCADERRLAFGADEDRRWIDFEITLKASEGDLTIGDDKEGTFGVRVAGTMKVDSKLGGEIVNSEGHKNKEAWGKRAAWVDYHGPVNGKTVGVAILNHPSSFRFPTYWHVRTYGLFCANPFGLSFFDRSKDKNGAHTIPAGDSITLRYRVLFHKGDEKEGKVAKEFAAYSEKK